MSTVSFISGPYHSFGTSKTILLIDNFKVLSPFISLVYKQLGGDTQYEHFIQNIRKRNFSFTLKIMVLRIV